MIKILDSTLRDGCQGEGINYTVSDKLAICTILDELGITYIEAGYPSSNPKDMEFFDRLKDLHLNNSKIVAFGSTHKKNFSVFDDENIKTLLKIDVPIYSIVGKSSKWQVENVLKATLDENINMIFNTIKYLVSFNKEVFFDAEHFFDGYIQNKDYAIKTIKSALMAGASYIVLCDTNGGTFPDKIKEIVNDVKAILKTERIGIHCHNDTGMAVAGSISAVQAGATQVQGTLLGYGERCGNANLSTIIPNLQLKLNYSVISNDYISKLTALCKKIAIISNTQVEKNSPFVGNSAFAHKAGMHIDGVEKLKGSFEHIDPRLVGNNRRYLLSELSGRSALFNLCKEIIPNLHKDNNIIDKVFTRLKDLENNGYSFEGANASFILLVNKEIGKYKPFFKLLNYTIISESPAVSNVFDRATIKIQVGSDIEITAAEGNGPINALDIALRKALLRFFPSVDNITLLDYKVRVLEGNEATGSKVRVVIDSTDGISNWSTIGVSTDVIDASWMALVDSIEYKLFMDKNS